MGRGLLTVLARRERPLGLRRKSLGGMSKGRTSRDQVFKYPDPPEVIKGDLQPDTDSRVASVQGERVVAGSSKAYIRSTYGVVVEDIIVEDLVLDSEGNILQSGEEYEVKDLDDKSRRSGFIIAYLEKQGTSKGS